MHKTVGIFEFEQHEEVLIITPTTNMGEIDHQENEAGIGYLFELLKSPAVKHVLVDFHKTDYFSSTALGVFVRLMKTIEGRSGRLAFFNVSDHEMEILQVAKLDHLWDICGSREAALQAVRK